MGIFDGIGYDPQDYSGIQGLLSRLMPSAQGTIDETANVPLSVNQPPPSQFPTPVAGPIASADLNSAPPIPTPVAAPIFANRAPADVYDPATYQPSAPQTAPTLFDRLSGSVNAAPLNVPAKSPSVAGDDDEEDDTPAAAPHMVVGSLGSKIPVPTFGTAADDPVALPSSAKPAEYTPPGAPANTTLPADPFAAAGDHLKAAWQSMRHGGGLIGGLSGLVTGQRDDPQNDVLQAQAAQQNQTARALEAAGIDPKLAAAAVQPGNTELLKNLFNQMSTQGTYTQETDKDGNIWNVNKQTGQKTIALQAKDDKFQNVNTKNSDGSESHQAFNTKTGEYTGGSSSNGKPDVDPESTGAERMAQLQATNPDYARRVQAAVNGDVPLPTQGQASRSPAAAKFIEDVLAVDGSTSASDFATRAATRKDYASGMASRVTKSLNTTIEHAGRLDAAVDKLGNYTYFPGMTNWLHDKVAGNTDPEYQKARSDFESAKEAFIKELDFTLSGGHSSVSGSAELRDKISRADSPEALHAAIQTDLHLLAARLDSHTTGYNQGTRSQRDGQDFLYPKNRAVFNKLMGTQDTSTGQPVPGVDSSPATETPAIPSLKVGESTTVGNVGIKRIN